jgi:hypothetical protein
MGDRNRGDASDTVRGMTNKSLHFFTNPRSKAAAPSNSQPRANLDGLEVSESSFGEWLQAGGDRRGQRRDAETEPMPLDSARRV